MDLNEVTLIGNMGDDPVVKVFESGNEVVNFSVATNFTYTKDGVKNTITEWHNIQASGHAGNLIKEYGHRGQRLWLRGRLQKKMWMAPDSDFEKLYVNIIVGDRDGQIILLSRETKNPEPDTIGGVHHSHNIEPEQKRMEFDDEIPF